MLPNWKSGLQVLGKETITISTHETAKEVLIKVKDEGIGIERDEVPYVFESFHQGKLAEKKECFDLRLTAVKAIVQGHGGRVLAESELGKGSVFTLILPKAGKWEDGK